MSSHQIDELLSLHWNYIVSRPKQLEFQDSEDYHYGILVEEDVTKIVKAAILRATNVFLHTKWGVLINNNITIEETSDLKFKLIHSRLFFSRFLYVHSMICPIAVVWKF